MKEEHFPFGEREIAYLSKRDPELGLAVSWMERPERKPLPGLFPGLIFYVISQRVSAKAAETEWARFQDPFSPSTPESIASFSAEEMQKVFLPLIAGKEGAYKRDP